MPKGPIRRAQLITPFGVGAMVVVRDGTSLISGGLDHWFESEYREDDSRLIDPDEFIVKEWRLQQLLKVDHFRQPPDFRVPQRRKNIPNCLITVPFLRFPRWHFCRTCHRLYEQPLSLRGRVKCKACEKKEKKRFLVQVPFIAMCDYGHIQDFPWREWVHRSAKPNCHQQMSLIATGGASLGAQKVKCECEKERTLASITRANPDGTTFLSNNLTDDKIPFLCQGKRPWLGTDEGEPCDRPLRGSLRSASNVYFADVRSAIYLPRGDSLAPSELISRLEEPPLSTLVELLSNAGMQITPQLLRGQHSQLLQPFTDEEIAAALHRVLSGKATEESVGEADTDDDSDEAFRQAEYHVLREPHDEKLLQIRAADLSQYEPEIVQYFSRIMFVNKLRETRALAGFTRVLPENEQTLEDRKALLWRHPPEEGGPLWLPAYVVYGEGIFLELDASRLEEWESRDDVQSRVFRLVERYRNRQRDGYLRPRPVGSRFLLLHTFAHLLINQLTFECGYSSAALRERLYVSGDNQSPMAGVLIYTAAGDSEGTMGGLVRMGKPGYLEHVIRRALEGAQWCSADPVCMEIGASGGQGPDSLNLAACHNCALVPETACEELNRFLDRAVVIGDIRNRTLGYFTLEDHR
ncbi:MAG: DUF1998 domain-containing protein [Candidatus Poribacteria bacterium]|nr:DUF1998 domain-containing protein [Candidatus Poribacteria bacterium]